MNRTSNRSTRIPEPRESALPPGLLASLRRPQRALPAIALLALLAIASCSKSNSPTAPYGGGVPGGGGGGGTGGTSFNFGPFAVGQSASFTFANAAIVGYHCIPHRAMGMVGEVLVDAQGADSAVVQIGQGGGLSFTPSTAHIKAGGHVRWVNASNLTIHTVTSD